MRILPDKDLKNFHTFSVSAQADTIICAETAEDLIEIYQNPSYFHLPKIVLGSGSDILFCNDFPGVVILNRLKGKILREDSDYFYLDIAGGEDWPELVKWSVDQGIYGLENLALIPGKAGSAPIQNIGAYGVEFQDVCDYVEVLELSSGKEIRLSRKDCCFAYRESIFKHDYKNGYIITSIGLKLSKNWKPCLAYGPLREFDSAHVSAQDIFDKVCRVRMEKLPDPEKTGNAGSFFKNPLVSEETAKKLQDLYPDMPAYATMNGVKLAAGWLIDRVGLKGYTLGNAQVHPRQALVITNLGKATAEEILTLAAYVVKTVKQKFAIELEHEVRFIRFGKEVYLADIKDL